MDDYEFRCGARNLALYVRDRSEKAAFELGFRWFATDRAPTGADSSCGSSGHETTCSDEYRLLEADTLGQALMIRDARRFDQAAFAKDYLEHSIEVAVALDIARARRAIEADES